MAERKIPSTGNVVADIAIGAVVLVGAALGGMFAGKKRQENKDRKIIQEKERQMQLLIRERDAVALELKRTSQTNKEAIEKLRQKLAYINSKISSLS